MNQHSSSLLHLPIAHRRPLPCVTTTDQPPVRSSLVCRDDDDDAKSGQATRTIKTTTVTTRHHHEAECDVCHQHLARYSCPKCPLQYCSVACYRDHGGGGGGGGNGNNSNNNYCTERFYQDRVSHVLDAEVKEREGGETGNNNNNNTMELLRRVHHHQQQEEHWNRLLQQNVVPENNDDDDSSSWNDATQVNETQLYELLVALEQEDEQQIAQLLSQPELKAAICRELGGGRHQQQQQQQQQQVLLQELSDWILKPWHPWWQTELSSLSEIARNQEEEQAVNVYDDHDDDDADCEPELISGKTLDELILTLPAFHTIYKTAARPELQFHLLDILYGIAWMQRLYMGPYNAKEVAHDACTTLLVASKVLSSQDVRYDSLPEAMIHCITHSTQCYQNGGGGGDNNGCCNVEWTVLANDLVSLCSCHRYVVRCLFEAMDILDEAAAMAKKRNDKEAKMRWKRAKKKLEFYASWSCHDVSVFADLSREVKIWIETWSLQEDKNTTIDLLRDKKVGNDSLGNISLPFHSSSSGSPMLTKIEAISVARKEKNSLL